jgi:hypothetical protein
MRNKTNIGDCAGNRRRGRIASDPSGGIAKIGRTRGSDEATWDCSGGRRRAFGTAPRKGAAAGHPAADRRADGERRRRPGGPRPPGGIQHGTARARVDGRRQCPPRHPLGRRRSGARRDPCAGVGGRPAGRDSRRGYAGDARPQAGDRDDPDRVCRPRRSGRRRHRGEPRAARRQHHRLQQLRARDRRKMAAAAQTDLARHHARRGDLQSRYRPPSALLAGPGRSCTVPRRDADPRHRPRAVGDRRRDRGPWGVFRAPGWW